jgi:phosphoribosylanthranilate isomerase
VNTIKAFRIGEGDNVEWKIYPYHEFTDMYLFDNGWAGNASQDKAAVYGGSGVQFDWSMIDKVSINKPYFLSGGISPSDATKLKEFAGAHKDMFAADVNSRFEVAPGDKDMVKIKSFLDELNS